MKDGPSLHNRNLALLEKCGACGGQIGIWVSCPACGTVEENLPIARIRRPVRHLVKIKATHCPEGHPLLMHEEKF